MTSPDTSAAEVVAYLTRPIANFGYRSAAEVFDIMCDRIESFHSGVVGGASLLKSALDTSRETAAANADQQYWVSECAILQSAIAAANARAEALERDEPLDRPDDITAASIKFQCDQCALDEDEFCCHDLDQVVVVGRRVLCLEHARDAPPSIRRKAPNVLQKLRRHRAAISAGIARAEALERELDGAKSTALKQHGLAQTYLNAAVGWERRADAAEAKLAKAVEALEAVLALEDGDRDEARYPLLKEFEAAPIRAILTEIEGKSK